jgi:Zn-dependent metalloprotease
MGVDVPEQLEGKLVILDRKSLLGAEEPPALAWKFDVEGPEGKQQVFVDAATGGVALQAFTPVTVSDNPLGCPFNPVPQFHVNTKTGVPDFITFGPTGLLLSESASGNASRVALAFFEHFPLVFGTGDVPNQFNLVSVEPDTDSPHFTHVTLQQMWARYPVYGAQLRVHLTPALAVSSISGNYVRDPQVVPEAAIGENEALNTAAQAIARLRLANANGGRRTISRREIDEGVLRIFGDSGNGRTAADVDLGEHETLNEVRAEIVSQGLVILPGVLSRVPNVGNHFAYQFETREAQTFVSATTGDIVFAIPTIQTANRLVYDAMSGNELTSPALVVNNGTPASATPLNADAAAADPLLLGTLGFYAGLGRSSWDGSDEDVRLVSNAALSLFTTCPNAFFDPFRKEMWFCLGEVAGDVVAHEFTHGVTWTTARLLPLDEQGALNEHYSDVMGTLAFPDATPGTWVMGETTPFARSLSNPSVSNYANFMERTGTCAGPLGPFTDRTCDAGFVHSNCGIGNRAAVLLADGDGSAAHKGIGRDRLAPLFLETLTKRMHSWGTYLDEVHNTWETARVFAANGKTVLDSTTPAPGDTLPFTGVADEVLWAFTQVGVDSRLITGWFSIPGGLAGGRGTVTFNQGQSLPAGYIVTDVELVIRAMVGSYPWWTGRSRVSGPGGGAVAFPGGVFGAAIISHGIGTASEQVDVRYFHSGFIPLDISVNLTTAQSGGGAGPGVLPTPQIAFLSAPRAHWAIGVGGKGDDMVNTGISIQGGTDAKIDNVEVELLDGNYDPIGITTSKGSPAAVVRYGPGGIFSWGASVDTDGSGGRDEEVGVHWWFDVGSACRYRVKYYASGTNVAPG